jgi:hypothetical protein
MTQLEAREVVPGLVVRADTARLRALGGSETNAQRTDTEDRAVTDARDFLVLSVDAASGTCVAVPLFQTSSPGSAPLEAKKQWGNIGEWLTAPVHYSRWQHWRIPVPALVEASADDPGAVDARRSYAAGDADTLQDLVNWASRNRCEFRPA